MEATTCHREGGPKNGQASEKASERKLPDREFFTNGGFALGLNPCQKLSAFEVC